MNEQWFLLKEKFSHLSVREQYIILFSGLFIVFMLFNTLYFDVKTTEKEKLKQSISQIKVTNQQLQLAIAEAEVTVSKDPNKSIDLQIGQYEKSLQKVDNKLLSLTNELITPQKMRKALQDLLAVAPGVEISSFITLQPQPLISAKDNNLESSPSNKQGKKEEEPTINLYRHSVRITLKGNYFALRDYLKNIETLPWAFYWQAFDYQVTTFPQAQLNIEMYSLSTKKEFIGV